MKPAADSGQVLDGIDIGLGAWQWGDRFIWGYGRGYGEEAVRDAFKAAVSLGVRLVDTAEIYGNGRSERLLGRFIRDERQSVRIATKYFPWPWRLTKGSVARALRGSLERMDLAKVDLYQVHWPTPLVSIERLMDAMAEAVHQGFVRAVGVSNFGMRDLLRAHSALARHGIPLASNQVHYSLLKRDVEKDGVLGACKELGIRLIAHTPLERGLLSGKYGPHRPPSGPRGAAYLTLMPKIPPLLQTLAAIGQAHGGRTCAQVALNWLICKGALPIPGAKSAAQAAENMGASGWQLSADDIAALDSLSDEIRR